ncbi:MAG: response regulator, partial [Desulfatitalea sp.]|nr:response regulator [Desulfatitalea sp.]NNK02208.1 response regulator [Desulfatitalea sp.]
SEPNPQLQPGAYQVLHVSDTGKGIDPEIIDRVFDPYFTTKKPGQGTGMGLSVVQGIVHGCGGAVAVNSAPGRGATFQIYLPIQQQHPRSRKATDDIRIFGHERILFVDDEPALTELGKELLQRMGYRVTTHTDSIQALTLFARHPENFDLVITDMTMPHMTGDVFAEKVIAIRPDIPIIICTGYSQKVNPEMIDRLGIRALILKPLVRNELGATIRRVMDGPRPHLKLV